MLILLFGMVFAVGSAVLYHYNFPLQWAIAWAVIIVSLQFALSPWLIDWIFKIRWTQPEEISPEFADYLRDLCKKRGIPVPRFGIIEDGNPNAFTYGHIPTDSRLVVTRGVQQMLTEEEFRAVVAHEVGHITHFDFIVMTFASLVPLILYTIYRWTGSRRREGGVFAVAMGAYIAYIISQYIVLFLSRVREYFADEHAAQSVEDANAISRALIKIAYGLARIPQEDPNAKNKDKKEKKAFSPGLLAGSMGICSLSSASSMAISSINSSGEFSADTMMNAMKWDLWNPWSRFFEFQSTHPLIARRVVAASKVASELGQNPLLREGEIPGRSYMPEFIRDFTILAMPWIGLITGFLLNNIIYPNSVLFAHQVGPFRVGLGGITLLLTGIGWMIRLAASFSSNYKPNRIADMVGEVDVSHIHSIPVELTGKVIGRGIPGILWSKDLVIQDETGFINLIYRQPLGILETLFGLLKADSFIGKDATIRGWYRRGPVPYIELLDAKFEDGSARCYRREFLWCIAAIFTAAGVLMLV